MNYWLEALESSLDEHGIFAMTTPEQRVGIAKDMEMAHQMHGEATGEIYIPNPLQEEIKKMEKKIESKESAHKREVEQWRNVLAHIGGEQPHRLHYNPQDNQIQVW